MGLFSFLCLAMLAGSVGAANDTVIIKFKTIGLSVNGSVDSQTLFPSPPPGVHLIADLPFLGYQVFGLDDPSESAVDYCAELEEEDDSVQFCEPDSEVGLVNEAASATPNDPLFGQQYNIPAINLPAVWELGVFGSTNVSVCFPDTGSSPDHPELQGSIKAGTSFVGGTQSSSFEDGNGHGQYAGKHPLFLYAGSVMAQIWLIVMLRVQGHL